MDFNLPQELQMLKDTVRKFVDKELIPIEMHTIENMELKPDIRERLEKKTKEMGLWMFDVPEEYGGGGLGSDPMAVSQSIVRGMVVTPPPSALSNAACAFAGSPARVEG